MRKITLFMIFSLITCVGCSRTLYEYKPKVILLTDKGVECVSDKYKNDKRDKYKDKYKRDYKINKDYGNGSYTLYFNLDNTNIWPGIFISVYATDKNGDEISAVVEGTPSNCGSFDFGTRYEIQGLPATRFSWRPDYTKKPGRISYNCPIVDPEKKLLPEHEEKIIALRIKGEGNEVIGEERLRFELKRRDEEATSCGTFVGKK